MGSGGGLCAVHRNEIGYFYQQNSWRETKSASIYEPVKQRIYMMELSNCSHTKVYCASVRVSIPLSKER